MTIRTTLKKKLRFVNSMVILGFVVFIVSCFLESGIVALSAFALIFGSIGYLYLGIRCPHCHNRVGYNLSSLTSCFKSQKVVKFCPFCATDLDTELHEPAA
jgi:hypothetical protein